mgnify:FL=1
MSKLPLFPLNLVILPYEYLPLHIFEPRYKIMITNNIEQNSPFGIIHKDGKNLYPKGCKVEVSKVYKKYQTGEYDILVRGIENFKIFNTKLDGEIIVGEVEYIPISMVKDDEMTNLIQDSYLKLLLKFGISNDLDLHLKKKISYEFLQGFQLPLEIKKELILMDNETRRLKFVHKIFKNLLAKDNKNDLSQIPNA